MMYITFFSGHTDRDLHPFTRHEFPVTGTSPLIHSELLE